MQRGSRGDPRKSAVPHSAASDAKYADSRGPVGAKELRGQRRGSCRQERRFLGEIHGSSAEHARQHAVFADGGARITRLGVAGAFFARRRATAFAVQTLPDAFWESQGCCCWRTVHSGDDGKEPRADLESSGYSVAGCEARWRSLCSPLSPCTCCAIWQPLRILHLFEGDYLASFFLIVGLGLILLHVKQSCAKASRLRPDCCLVRLSRPFSCTFLLLDGSNSRPRGVVDTSAVGETFRCSSRPCFCFSLEWSCLPVRWLMDELVMRSGSC